MEGIDGMFGRVGLLLGDDALAKIKSKSVIVFGVGGVGSWCVESLVRSGIGRITIVDFDRVCESNINRQLVATTATVGQQKVDIMKRRILDINPDIVVDARCEMYTAETADTFHLEEYDYVIDAIDSIENKALLIRRACEIGASTRLFSSMGAALKLDPSRIGVAEFWKVKGCPLAAALRRRFKRSGEFPKRKFKCVYSDELVKNRGTQPIIEGQKQVNGTLSHITAIFGFTLSWLVISDITAE